MIKKILMLSGVDGVLKLCGYFLLPVYLNLMTKEDFGEFGYITSVIGALPPILTLGLYVVLIKEQSQNKNKEEQSEALSSILYFVILVVSVFCFITAAFGLAHKVFDLRFNTPFQELLKTAFILIAIFFGTLNLVIYSQAVSLKNSPTIIKYNILKFIVVNVFGIGFLILWLELNDDSLKRLCGLALSEIILFLITYYWLCKDKVTWGIKFSLIKKYLKAGISIVPGSCAAIITIASDRYFLNDNFGLSYVADYNLALQFVLPIQLIITGAQTIWAPHVFSIPIRRVAFDASISFLRKVSILFAIGLAMISTAVYTAVKVSIIPSIYQDVVKLVPILGVSAIFLAMNHVFQNLFVKFNQPQYISYLSIAGAVMTVVAGYLLIPIFGYWAAAALSVLINMLLLVASFKISKNFALA